MSTTHGTRFELVLESSEGSAKARYRATVHTPEGETSAVVEITQSGAAVVSGGEGIQSDHGRQLVAIAKTLGKRADAAPWPRRINRWRQPGVR